MHDTSRRVINDPVTVHRLQGVTAIVDPPHSSAMAEPQKRIRNINEAKNDRAMGSIFTVTTAAVDRHYSSALRYRDAARLRYSPARR
jgi:hypothetical protein